MNATQEMLKEVRNEIVTGLSKEGVVVLPPMDVHETLKLANLLATPVCTTMLDPWYNKGVGGVREDYVSYVVGILNAAAGVSLHTFLWGFPEIIAPFVERIPKPLKLVAWLTWCFRNNPSVIRGWRSAQMTCLHLSHPGAKLYVEHFLNEAQLNKLAEGKLRYMPGPPSIIEQALLVGFVGRKEQTGHPSQKPVKVIEPLLMMATKEGDLVLDPMSGSGTTGQAARNLGRYAILCDHSEDYTQIAEKRLSVRRLSLPKAFRSVLEKDESLTPPTWPSFRKPVSYGLQAESVQSAGTRQMALLETYGNGPGTRGAGKSQGRSPRFKARA